MCLIWDFEGELMLKILRAPLIFFLRSQTPVTHVEQLWAKLTSYGYVELRGSQLGFDGLVRAMPSSFELCCAQPKFRQLRWDLLWSNYLPFSANFHWYLLSSCVLLLFSPVLAKLKKRHWIYETSINTTRKPFHRFSVLVFVINIKEHSQFEKDSCKCQKLLKH